ncbi:MAG: protein kinase [Deltaproteobacteria bacterium]|nr:protein kinase [Deltaproteobacteria bacterium]
MQLSSPTKKQALQPGRLVNERYRILELLGEGGMGVVYRAEQLPLGREVALKVLRMQALTDQSFRQRFFLEASLTAQLNHPNLVTVYDYGRVEPESPDEEESYFLALELLRGTTLHDRIVTRGALEVSVAVEITRGILRGLRLVHKQGIIHRDLKPANVMIVADDEGRDLVKVLDFGLVKQLTPAETAPGAAPMTRAGSLLGTPEYMSPEHMDPQDVDARADLYAVGVMLFEMLTGHPPFHSERHLETLFSHLTAPVPALRDKNSRCNASPELEAVVRKLLEKSKEKRFTTADEVLDALASLSGVAPAITLDSLALGSQWHFESSHHYALGRLTRENASSQWYEATQVSLDRPVSVQVFSTQNAQSLARLRRACIVQSALRNRANPRMIDAGEASINGRRSAFVVYESIRGELLSDALVGGVKLSTPRAVRIALDLLEALTEAHSLGLAHGVIRPEVVMLQSGDGRARFVEYDIESSPAESSTSHKQFDMHLMRYFAPERLRGGRRSERSDIYAVGALLFQCLAGEPLRNVTHDLGALETTRAPALRPSMDLSHSVVSVVARAIAEDPNDRYESARAFHEALKATQARLETPSRSRPMGLSALRWSEEPISLWLLDSDPVFSRPVVRDSINFLRQSMEVRVVSGDHRETMAGLLRQEKIVPPWVVLYGDMDVILEDPLLAMLGAAGEVSRVLLSTHLNVEMLQRSVNFCGCDQQLALPLGRDDLYNAVARMLERTRGIREHYDRLRNSAADSIPAAFGMK